MRSIFEGNLNLCADVSENVISHFVSCIENQGKHVEYLKTLQALVCEDSDSLKRVQDTIVTEVCAVQGFWAPYLCSKKLVSIINNFCISKLVVNAFVGLELIR